MSGMRHVKQPGWTTVFVLGMLFLRALVPAGFMLAPVDGTPAFVLCGPRVFAGHHHHQGLDHAAAREHDGHADPTCPYAQSAGPAPLPTLPALAHGAIIDPLVSPAVFTQTRLIFGPIRQQTSRGPPHLA
jgi:hypothetical protein